MNNYKISQFQNRTKNYNVVIFSSLRTKIEKERAKQINGGTWFGRSLSIVHQLPRTYLCCCQHICYLSPPLSDLTSIFSGKIIMYRQFKSCWMKQNKKNHVILYQCVANMQILMKPNKIKHRYEHFKIF